MRRRLLAVPALALLSWSACAVSSTVPPADPVGRNEPLGSPRAPTGEERLDNGLQVVRIAGHDGWFEAALLFAGGPLLDPVDRPGLTDWTVRMALLATEGDPEEAEPPMVRALALGLAVIPITQGNLFGWALYGPTEARPEALELLADLAMRPSFPAVAMQVHGSRERQRIETRG
ncbi:MAG: hypothetical protein QF464_14675, partial [Myxococcota bacterium]|nr:hypothetical protein [Myxococcota bacterium]